MFDGCIYFNTAALARQLERRWAIAYAQFDLTVPQGFLLRAVLEQPGIAPNTLAKALAITRPTVTRSLDGLEIKGLIERLDANEDGRVWEIHPTKQALAMHDALNQASHQVTRQIKKVMGDANFAKTVHQIRMVRSALS